MTTLCTTAGQNLTAVGSLHPLAEAMDRLTATSVWLKCALHFKKFYVLYLIPRFGAPSPPPVKGSAKLGKNAQLVEKKREKIARPAARPASVWLPDLPARPALIVRNRLKRPHS